MATSSKKTTDIKDVLARAKIIFSSLLISMYLLANASFYVGYKSGELKRIVVDPPYKAYQTLIATIKSVLEELSKTDVRPANRYSEINVVATSESKVNININGNSYTYPQPTRIQNRYMYPTYAYPTIKPGDLGSQEWLDNFWKGYRENEQRTKNLQQKQEQFCLDNSDLCNR